MNSNNEINKPLLNEKEIDEIVSQQAEDDSAWTEPINVYAKPASLSLPREIVAKAMFYASLHREINVDAWLIRVIQERLELEEAAFLQIKGDLAKNTSK